MLGSHVAGGSPASGSRLRLRWRAAAAVLAVAAACGLGLPAAGPATASPAHLGPSGTSTASGTGGWVLSTTDTISDHAPTFIGNGYLAARVPAAGEGYSAALSASPQKAPRSYVAVSAVPDRLASRQTASSLTPFQSIIRKNWLGIETAKETRIYQKKA